MTLATAALVPSAVPDDARPSLDELFSQHLRFVWRILGAYGVRDADVEDAAQEVFLTVHRRRDDWDPARASIRTWLHGIAVRVAANYRRLAHVRHEQADGAVEPVARTDPDASLDNARLFDEFRLALDRLDEKKRVVFVLHEIEELPMSEVAAIVGCPVKTGYARYYAAQSELAGALARSAKGRR